ncbi:MAG: hypothetical protein ACK4OP_12330 [Gemmobacter sp.]
MTLAIQIGVDALSLGGLWALTALGIGLIFSVMRPANFAHAALVICGAHALFFRAQTGFVQLRQGLPIVITALVATVIDGLGSLPGAVAGGFAIRAIGIRMAVPRLGAFGLGAFLFGGAGALYGHFQGKLRVENFCLDPTFLMVTMLVVGGQRSLTGAVAGAIAISALAEALRQVELGVSLPLVGTVKAAAGFGDVVLAAVMLAILIFRPGGLTAGREAADFLRRRR